MAIPDDCSFKSVKPRALLRPRMETNQVIQVAMLLQRWNRAELDSTMRRSYSRSKVDLVCFCCFGPEFRLVL